MCFINLSVCTRAYKQEKMRTLCRFALVLFCTTGVYSSSAQCIVDAGPDLFICEGDSAQIGGSPALINTPDQGAFSWGWNNGLDTIQNPFVSPIETTSYTIYIEGDSTCYDTDEVTVFVYDLPDAGFTFAPDGLCSSVPIEFSADLAGGENSFAWDFGDGTTATNSANQIHFYEAFGNSLEYFDVVLTVTDQNGCANSSQETITVQQFPEINLIEPTYNFIKCDGNESFSIGVLDGTNPSNNLNYFIDWGDSSDPYESTNPPTPLNAENTYEGLGMWDLTYIVEGLNGCSNDTVIVVANITNPAVGASSNGNTTACAPIELCFNINNAELNHESTTYTVDFGDNTPDEEFSHPPPSEVCHEYATTSCPNDPYTMTLTAENVCSFSQATINPIIIFIPPSSSFYAQQPTQCVNSAVNFINTSSVGYGNNCAELNSFFWDFGDGATQFSATNDNQSHTYNAPGTYTVTLTSYNFCNQDDPNVFTQEVCIEEPLSPDFIWGATSESNGCVPFSFAAINTTVNPEICALSTSWNMQYLDIDCPSNWNWWDTHFQFINGTNTGSETPEIEVLHAGTFELELIQTNSCGTFTHSDIIDSYDLPEININSLPDICAGENASVGANYESCNTPITSYDWVISGSENVSSTEQNPGNTTWAAAGDFNVELTATNICGSVYDSESILVQSPPNLSIESSAGSAICNGAETTLTASGANSYNWSSSPFLSSVSSNSTIASPSVSSVFTVTGYTSAGCPSTEQFSLEVWELPEISQPDIPIICAGDSVIIDIGITGGSEPYLGYNWSPCHLVDISVSNSSNSNEISWVISSGGTIIHQGGVGESQACLLDGCYSFEWFDSAGNGWGSSSASLSNNYTGELVFDDFTVINGASSSIDFCLGIGSPIPETLNNNNLSAPTAFPNVTSFYQLEVADVNGCIGDNYFEVFVNPLPAVDAGNALTFCNQPIEESLFPSPITNGVGFWEGDGITDAGGFLPFEIGSFSLLYTFTDLNSCVGVDSVTINVVELTAANAGPDLSFCGYGSPVEVQAETPGGSWDGIGITEEGVFFPTDEGIYEVTYFLGSGSCASSDSLLIEVFSVPVVSAGEDISICFGEEASVTGEVIGGTDPYVDVHWSPSELFGNGEVFLDTLFAESSLEAVLTVTDFNGCTGSDNLYVTVHPLPSVYAGEDLDLCNQEIQEVLDGYSPLSGTEGNGFWSGVGVTPDGVFTPFELGSFDVVYQFTSAFGCSSQDSILIVVDELELADAGSDQTVCLNAGLLELTGFYPIENVTWSGPGIGVPELNLFNPYVSGEGIHTITLEAGAGTCYSSDNLQIEVLGLPAISANPASGVCPNDAATIELAATPAGGTWGGEGIIDPVTGEFDPSIGAGNFDVFYTFTSPATGCADTAQIVQIVNELPQAAFTLAPIGCSNDYIDIINNSLNASSFSWQLGAGQTSNEITPIYFNPEVGFHDLTLIAASEFGCLDTAYAEHEIIDPPIAAIEISESYGCAPVQVGFANTSSGSYLSFLWDFGVGTSTLQTPDTITFLQGDDIVIYPISLEVTNICGTDLATDTITALPVPVANFATNLNEFCSPFVVEINNLTTGNAEGWQWDFGDGTTSASEEPGSHTFFTDSLISYYNLTLLATNDCGVDSSNQTITVLPNNVTAFFSADVAQGCAPLEVQFTDFSEGTTAVSYDFGDGFLSADASPLHTFESAGSFIVQQFVGNGCAFDTTSIQISVIETAELSFDSEPPFSCPGEPVQFINQSDGISSVFWDFGDGLTSTATNPIHIYDSGGEYEVTLAGTTVFTDCVSETSSTHTVYDSPSINISPDVVSGCSPLLVTIENTTSNGDFFSWDFGDGNGSNSANTQHLFQNNSENVITNTVTLTVENALSCSSVQSFDVSIFPSPTSDFNYLISQDFGFPVEVQFLNNSIGADGYNWQFSIGSASSLTNPSLLFNAPGEYYVSLSALNEYGCADISYRNILLEDDLNFYVPNSFTPDNDGFNDSWKPSITGKAAVSEYSVQIFNRWGEIVWESTDPEEGWIGQSVAGSGEYFVPDGLYTWQIKLKFQGGEDSQLHQGHVSLFR